MDDFKKAIDSVMRPIFVGLRKDLRTIRDAIYAQSEQRAPDVQKSEVTNWPEAPDVQKVEQINPTDNSGIVKQLDGIRKATSDGNRGVSEQLRESRKKSESLSKSERAALTTEGDKTRKAIDTMGVKVIKSVLRAKEILNDIVFRVIVENQTEVQFPEMQLVKQEGTADVHIRNREPNEAIPVRMVDKEARRFIELVVNVMGGEVNFGNIKKLLSRIAENTGGTEEPPIVGTNTTVSVGTTATQIAFANAERVELEFTNDTNRTAFWGYDDTVTVATGMPLRRHDIKNFKRDNPYDGPIFAIVAASTADFRIAEH